MYLQRFRLILRRNRIIYDKEYNLRIGFALYLPLAALKVNTMSDNILDSRRVAKNTVVLYVRTIVTLIISLYTSRAILNILGVENYGIYNVVGGFVSMFALMSNTLVSATQRYLNFEFGKLKDNHSQEVFSTSIVIHAFLSIILFFLFETFGLWFLNAKLNIAPDRMVAANWLFQFSVLTFILSIMRSPFDASIIAHERMTTFAYTNILEAVLKLAIIYCLLIHGRIDKLVLYGFLMLMISVLVFVIYMQYCKHNFKEIKFTLVKDKSYYMGMLSFAGYNFASAASVVFANQGVNILLNMFFGVVVNAAKGVTTQVQSAISKFVSDFTIALNPQITKSYAQGNIPNMMSLIFKGTKIAYLLFLIFAVPIIIETPYILKIWLKVVPDYAVVFVRLSLLNALLNTLAGPISTGALATGNIKSMSIWIGIVRLMVFPMSFLAFYLGGDPSFAYITHIASDLVLCYIRLYFATKLIGVKKMPYVTNVILRIIPITIIALGVTYSLSAFMKIDNLFMLCLYAFASCFTTCVLALTLAFNNIERQTIISMILMKRK